MFDRESSEQKENTISTEQDRYGSQEERRTFERGAKFRRKEEVYFRKQV